MQHWTEWELERLVGIIRLNAKIAAEFQRDGTYDQTDDYGRLTRESIRAGYTFDTLTEATRLLAHARDVTWEPADTRLIWEKGDEGFQQVMQRYGLSASLYEADRNWLSSSTLLPMFETVAFPPPTLSFASFDLHRPIVEPIRWEGLVVNEQEQRESLALAYEAAKDYAAARQGWLLITGPVGAGKTHLAAAIYNEMRRNGESSLYLSAPSFRRRYKTIDDPRWLEEKTILETVQLLIFDDIDIGSGFIWNNHFEQVLLARRDQALPTVLVAPSGSVALPGWVNDLLVEIIVLVGSYRRLPLL